MGLKWMKSLLVAAFRLTLVFSTIGAFAQQNGEIASEQKKGFDANEVIFGHVKDAHEFHFLSYKGSDGQEHEAFIPLPGNFIFAQKRVFRFHVLGFSP